MKTDKNQKVPIASRCTSYQNKQQNVPIPIMLVVYQCDKIQFQNYSKFLNYFQYRADITSHFE